MKILVTGGAGFIGHNLAIYLAQRGYTPTLVDNFEKSAIQVLRRLKEHDLSVIRGDARDKYLMKTLVERSDIVVHAAAYTSVEESFEKPLDYIANNVGSTVVVASTCFELGKPLIYLSSAAVYGNPVRTPIREDHPLNPVSPYGLSKMFGEKVVEFYGELGLQYTIVRPFNVYGVGQLAGVVARFLERACKNEPLVIYGDGRQVRDFIHVLDLSRLLELVISKNAWGYVFNAGSGIPTRIIDLALTVVEVTKSKSVLLFEPQKPGDIRVSWADTSKARGVLGYEPRIPLVDGIRELVPYYCTSVTQA